MWKEQGFDLSNYKSNFMCRKNESDNLMNNIWISSNGTKDQMMLIKRENPESEAELAIVSENPSDIMKHLEASEVQNKELVKVAILKILRHPAFFSVDSMPKAKINIENALIATQPKELLIFENKLRNYLYKKFTTRSTAKLNNRTRIEIEVPENDKLKKEIFGNPFTYIMYDCENPSVRERIFDTEKKKINLKTTVPLMNGREIMEQAGFSCNKDDGIWYSGERLVGYDVLLKSFDTVDKRILALMKYMSKDLCEKFMSLWSFPYKTYKKKNVFVCDSPDLDRLFNDEYEKTLEVLRDGNFSPIKST